MSFGLRPNLVPDFIAALRPSLARLTMRSRSSSARAERTREGEAKVVEPMIEHDAGHRDAERAGVGEVGQAHQPRRMLLPEDHVMLGAFECPRPCSARLRHDVRMRRSCVRRMLGLISGRRRRISLTTAIARMPGLAFRIGTTSL